MTQVGIISNELLTLQPKEGFNAVNPPMTAAKWAPLETNTMYMPMYLTVD